MKNIKPPIVSSQDWAALYEATQNFRESRCWEWMYDQQLFAVKLPETQEIVYCSVMGQLGEVFALNVYPGAEGLYSYLLTLQYGEALENMEELPMEVIANAQHCLMASFEDRDALEKPDHQVIKELGLKFRGAQAYPFFRSYLPGFPPWFLNTKEVQTLTVALQQTLEVAKICLEDDSRFEALQEVPARCWLRQWNGTQWEDTWQIPQAESPIRPFQVDELALKRLQHLHLAHQHEWIIDYRSLPVIVEEGERPYYPIGLIALSSLGMVVALELVSPLQFEQELPAVLLQILEKVGSLPKTIMAINPHLIEVLQVMAPVLKIEVQEAEELPGLEGFWEQFMSQAF